MAEEIEIADEETPVAFEPEIVIPDDPEVQTVESPLIEYFGVLVECDSGEEQDRLYREIAEIVLRAGGRARILVGHEIK